MPANENESHTHCNNCFRTKCTRYPPCLIMQCSLSCGAAFHTCKQSEHCLLCPLEKVLCINATCGCPVVLRRADVQRHLVTCAANVVCCTMEWCRWPMYSRERQKRVPFAPNNLRARCRQLDVAMALRDQRALADSKKSLCRRRSVLRSLRNKFTPQHPAVPLFVGSKPVLSSNELMDSGGLPSEGVDREEEDTEEEWEDASGSAPWLTSKEPPGLQRSICTELFSQEVFTKGDSRPTLIEQMHNTSDEAEIKCSLCARSSVSPLRDCLSGETHHMAAKESDNLSETNCIVFSELAAAAKDLVGESTQQGGCNVSNSFVSESSNYGDNCLLPATISAKHLASDNCLSSSSCDTLPIPIPPPASPPLALHQVLAVDLNIEQYSRYQQRPTAIYSFICGQLFRRDQFADHVHHVHSDVHDKISDWLEVRCPLAHCGCTFSVRRLQPVGGELVFSPLLESFGVKRQVDEMPSSPISPILETTSAHNDSRCIVTSRDNEPKEQTPDMFTSKYFDSEVSISTPAPLSRSVETSREEEMFCLTSLPMEILCRIARYLDSFSLLNLAVTCWLLRDVCHGLVRHRGIVVQEWKRTVLSGGRVTWTNSHQRWMFSSAFESISTWRYTDHQNVSEHLRVCPFNIRQPWTEERIALVEMAGQASQQLTTEPVALANKYTLILGDGETFYCDGNFPPSAF